MSERRSGWKPGFILAALAGLAAALLFTAEVTQHQLNKSSVTALLKPTGSPQLIATEKLPENSAAPEGEMCEFVPASANSSITELLRAEDIDAKNSIDVDRAPVRTIRDSYPT